jgi:hypothetical protein
MNRSGGTVTLNLKDLDDLRKQLEEGKNLRVHVGILGDRNQREEIKAREAKQHWSTKKTPLAPAKPEEQLSNADIGLRHEFGSLAEKLPMRSWLRMPLYTHLADRLERIGKAFFLALTIRRGMWQALRTLGIQAEATIQEGFENGGWGQWPELSQYTVQLKGSSAILIDTAQMRQSVTSAVVKKGSE